MTQPNRRHTDPPTGMSLTAHFEGRVASIETTVQNQGRLLQDFVQETRKSTGELFDGLNRLSDTISAQRSTNWQQLGVMLSLASAVGGFIYMAFVAPLQEGQRRDQAAMEKAQDAQLQLLERIHQNELEIRVHEALDKGRTP